MAFDGITMALVRQELNDLLLGARVEKIYQPQTHEIVLHLRTKDTAYHLICSAATHLARVHLTKEKPEHPPVPQAFCMLLRKHFTGARIIAIEQPGLERILTFTFRSYDDFGATTKKSLICELMGKHSNLILTMPQDGADPVILGSIKIVDGTMSRYRVVMSGEPYYLPPAQDKIDLFTLTEEELTHAVAKNITRTPENILMNSIMGIGKDLAHELVHHVSAEELLHPLEMIRPLTIALRELANKLLQGKLIPGIIQNAGKKPRLFFLPTMVSPGDHVETYSSVNASLDVFYTTILRQQAEQQLRSQLEQIVTGALVRIEKKRHLQEAELYEMANADQFRIWGELLTASLYQLHSGMIQASVPNYYADNAEVIEIPLNPALSPQQNAQRYFKKYRKLRDGTKYITKRLRETCDEISYLESLHVAATHADMLALLEIRDEMESMGLIRSKHTKKTIVPSPSQPLHFVSPDGLDIYVGKNNRQNEQLTTRSAHKEDLWLHVKDIPGSHVIIKDPSPPETTIIFAAKLAATYSKAAASANVPVDYTHVKFVKKPKGAKPGMVIYTQQKTVYVTPNKKYE